MKRQALYWKTAGNASMQQRTGYELAVKTSRRMMGDRDFDHFTFRATLRETCPLH
jgi:hypothetical protein